MYGWVHIGSHIWTMLCTFNFLKCTWMSAPVIRLDYLAPVSRETWHYKQCSHTERSCHSMLDGMETELLS